MIERFEYFLTQHARLWIPAALLALLALTLPLQVDIMQAHIDDLSFFAGICTSPTFN